MKYIILLLLFACAVPCSVSAQTKPQSCREKFNTAKQANADKQYDKAVKYYIAALICDESLAAEIAPELETVLRNINAQKTEIENALKKANAEKKRADDKAAEAEKKTKEVLQAQQSLQAKIQENYEASAQIVNLLLSFSQDSIRKLNYIGAWDRLIQAYDIDYNADKRNAQAIKNLAAEIVFFLYYSEKDRRLPARKPQILKAFANAAVLGKPYTGGDTIAFLGRLWQDLADAKTDTLLEYRYFGKMIPIKAGSFFMGDTLHDFPDNKSEYPVHEVSLDAFEMGETEVTVWQYFLFCEATGYEELIAYYDKALWGGNHPAVDISWYDGMSYCRWLNEQKAFTNPPFRFVGQKGYNKDSVKDVALYLENYDTLTHKWTGKGYRLPTEAEWEYAARAGGYPRFGNGKDTADSREMNYDATSDYNRFSRKGQDQRFTTKVKFFAANAWGLYDMSGNLWEWCYDSYDENFYSKNNNINKLNSTNFETNATYKVLRGGSWYDVDLSCRVSYRYLNEPYGSDVSLGFRVVR